MSTNGGIISILAITAAVAAYALLPALSNNRLALVEQLIDWRYTTPSISAKALRNSMNKQTVLFDVRTPAEYAVSHLPNAINVSPELSTEEFMQQFAQQIAGKRLVFYCSVGQRSSALADRLSEINEQHGGSEIANLKGGIFRWASNGFPMENEQGKTSAAHPYSQLAAKLLPPAVPKTTAPDT